MKTYVIAALFASAQAACTDDNTSKMDVIYTAMTSHHNTALAKKTADITQYETDLNAKLLLVTNAQTALDEAKKAGEAAATAAGTTVMPAAESQAVQAAE